MTQRGQEFLDLRGGFEVLSDLISANAGLRISGSALRVAREADIADDLAVRLAARRASVREIAAGHGQRSSVSGRREVVVSVLACGEDEARHLEVCAIAVRGRGAIERAVTVRTRDADWSERLRGFIDWNDVEAVIPAVEGNNQRAAVGLVLAMAGIGRGRLAMIEVEIPEEVDEAAQMIRGADWFKAGLPRFVSAASEAVWYLMRIRSVHARNIRTRKQGLYTSMAVGALVAAGVEPANIATALGMAPATVRKLTPPAHAARPARLADLGAVFADLDALEPGLRQACAARIWRGAAIFANGQAARNRIADAARQRLAAGDDLVVISASLSVARRDLVRALSRSAEEGQMEVARFREGVLDPALAARLAAEGVGGT